MADVHVLSRSERRTARRSLLAGLVAALSVAALASACSSGSSSATGPGGRAVPPIPDGTYSVTVTVRDGETSGDPNLDVLSNALSGTYELTLDGGHYRWSRDGATTVPFAPPSHTREESGYISYGFWVARGVPPIGEGEYFGDGSLVAFRTTKGGCFQKGISEAIRMAVYRWSLDGSELSFDPATAQEARSLVGHPLAADDCVGRAFVLPLRPWTRRGA
jgi:hypothetical protein